MSVRRATNDALMSAIHDDRLAELDDPSAQAACDAIGARMAAETETMLSSLAEAGIALAHPPALEARMQRHAVEFALEGHQAALSAASILQAQGFVVWEPTERGAGRVHARCRSVLTLARTTDVTIAVRLRWPDPGLSLPGFLTPNQADFAAVDLPTALWPLYFVVRPLRLAAERIGLRSPDAPTLGPFLSTPADIIPGLLDLAGITESDTLADLGCGDGRILVDAVKRTGCKAIGIESDPALVEAATQRAADAGVADRVTIISGDATSTELGRATAVFVFLPADATVELVARLLTTLEPGTRIIAHEQHRLAKTPGGVTSTALIEGQGVTVAHQWTVGR